MIIMMMNMMIMIMNMILMIEYQAPVGQWGRCADYIDCDDFHHYYNHASHDDNNDDDYKISGTEGTMGVV